MSSSSIRYIYEAVVHVFSLFSTRHSLSCNFYKNNIQSHLFPVITEAVNENESESCGNNINNNILLGERPSGATGLDRGKDHGSSEAETLTANKEEGNSNINNPPGIVIAAAVTTVPGVLRRVKKSNFKSNNKVSPLKISLMYFFQDSVGKVHSE